MFFFLIIEKQTCLFLNAMVGGYTISFFVEEEYTISSYTVHGLNLKSTYWVKVSLLYVLFKSYFLFQCLDSFQKTSLCLALVCLMHVKFGS